MGLWDSHGTQFMVPALLLIPDCDHSAPNVVLGFQDGNLGSGEAAAIPRSRLFLLPPCTPTPPSHRLSFQQEAPECAG